MLELDLMLNQFFAQRLDQLSESQLEQLEALLQQPDPVLYSWLMGSTPADGELHEIVRLVQLQD